MSPEDPHAKLWIQIRCPGRKVITFKPGESIKIGRHSDNDLVFKHETVSRFHATLCWDRDEDRPQLVDEESANGVEIDGVPVLERSPLSGNNSISIGDFTFHCELKGSKESRGKGISELRQHSPLIRILGDDGGEVRGTFASPEMLKETLLKLEATSRTGTMRIKAGSRSGALTFSRGLLVSVTQGTLEGLPALRALLSCPLGSYHFELDLEPSEEVLELSLKSFLSADSAQAD